MISLSISGKNWIFKKYNQENITFLKENFSLDEITSKLLSIRKIKREDWVIFSFNHNELLGDFYIGT